MENRPSHAIPVLVAAVCASPVVAQVCTTAVVPADNLMIQTGQSVDIGGVRCTAPGDPCETIINFRTPDIGGVNRAFAGVLCPALRIRS